MIGRRHPAMLLASAVLALCSPAAAAATQPLSVTVDRQAISTALGHTFRFRTTIANHGPQAAAGLIAHLNVLSLRDGVYIDPEDWSAQRTRYLAPIPAGGSVMIGWKLHAVNAGRIGVYVTVLTQSGAVQPTTGPPVRVSVARRTTLNAGGILPLSLGLPALLVALTLGVRAGRRKAEPSRRGDSS